MTGTEWFMLVLVLMFSRALNREVAVTFVFMMLFLLMMLGVGWMLSAFIDLLIDLGWDWLR